MIDCNKKSDENIVSLYMEKCNPLTTDEMNDLPLKTQMDYFNRIVKAVKYLHTRHTASTPEHPLYSI